MAWWRLVNGLIGARAWRSKAQGASHESLFMFFAGMQNFRVHQSAGAKDVSGNRTNCGAHHDTCPGVHLPPYK
jgi:hypothetical protein